jgi:predicted small secreted protein
MLRKILYCLAALMALTVSACNTTQGLGRDVSAAGNKISGEAAEHKHY